MTPAPIKEPIADGKSFANRTWIRWFQSIQNAIDSAITESSRITFADSPYQIPNSGRNVVCNTAGGAITVTLPVGVQGQVVRLVNSGSAGNSLTIQGNGTDLIYGAATKVLSDKTSLEVRFDSVDGWF